MAESCHWKPLGNIVVSPMVFTAPARNVSMLITVRKRRIGDWGGVNADSNPDLAIFTTKVLLDEIKARGYRGTLEYRKTITL